MSSHHDIGNAVALLLGVAVLGLMGAGLTEAQLQMGFYSKSCPKAEDVVRKYIEEHIPNAPSLAAALLRMNFHDCFVRVGDVPGR